MFHLQVSREPYVDSLEKGLKMQFAFPKGFIERSTEIVIKTPI